MDVEALSLLFFTKHFNYVDLYFSVGGIDTLTCRCIIKLLGLKLDIVAQLIDITYTLVVVLRRRISTN